MDQARVDLVLKYALAVAGQEDPGNQELGPIHLIKYVYLADLVHAQRHAGTTFTCTPWRFYHFGPWAAGVFERLAPVAHLVEARERRFSYSNLEGEGVRWSLRDETVLRESERSLPTDLALELKRLIHKFGSDTYGLLHYVYATLPMLSAAPGEALHFSSLTEGECSSQRLAGPPRPVLSKSESKKRLKVLTDLRERVAAKLLDHGSSRSSPTPPRYDDVFFDGLHWLDELGGTPVAAEHGELKFSDEVWKSRGRGEPDLP